MSHEESWKQHPNYQDLQVSTRGQVRTTNKILKDRDNGHGYRSLNRNNKTVYVHRLVAETFLPNPEGYPQVNHIDGVKQNNTVDNLEWVTSTQNYLHARDVLLVMPYVSDATLADIYRRRMLGAKLEHLAASLGILRSSLWNLLNTRFPDQQWRGILVDRKKPTLKYNAEDITRVREMWSGGRTTLEISDKIGIPRSMVYKILKPYGGRYATQAV